MTAVSTGSAPARGGAPAGGWAGAVGVVTAVTVGISALNYGFSLTAARVLPAGDFSAYAAVQSVLLVLGTGTLAASPWAVARYIARNDGPDVLREGFTFGVAAAVVQAVVLGPLVGLLCYGLGGAGLGLAGGLAAVGIALFAGPSGYLQGRGWTAQVAWLHLLETVGRVVAAGVLLVVAGRTAVWAVSGFPVGSALALAVALWLCREAFPGKRPSGVVVRQLLRQSAGSGGIQVALVMLGALDSVYVNGGRFPLEAMASYQAAALIGRVPIFLSSAIAFSSYTTIAAAPGPEVAAEIRHAVRLYAGLAVPFAVLCWTVPPQLLAVVVPSRYGDAAELLRLVVVAGVMIGLVDLLTTAHQARAQYRAALLVTGSAVVLQGVLLVVVGRGGSVTAFAVVFALLVTATAAALVLTLGRALRAEGPPARARAPRGRQRPPAVAVAGLLLCGVLVALLHHSVAWLLPGAGVAVAGAYLGFAPQPRAGPATPLPDVPLPRSAPRRSRVHEG